MQVENKILKEARIKRVSNGYVITDDTGTIGRIYKKQLIAKSFNEAIELLKDIFDVVSKKLLECKNCEHFENCEEIYDDKDRRICYTERKF